MRITVGIVDYGIGNLTSLSRAVVQCDCTPRIVSKPHEFEEIDRLLLPGVGAFGHAMDELRARGLLEVVRAWGLAGNPMMGICLGMQLLFAESEEFGLHQGLGLLPGRVVRMDDRMPDGATRRVPHIGWSPLQPSRAAPGRMDEVFGGFREGDSCYFVHSFVAMPDDPGDVIAESNFQGFVFPSVVGRGAVVGCQFHPEKSGEAGLRILRQFAYGDVRNSAVQAAR